MSARHSIGRKKQRALKGAGNPQLEQPAYNPPRPIGASIKNEFPVVEPRERREEAHETHAINGQNYRAQHHAKNIGNSMKSNMAYGNSNTLIKDAKKLNEHGIKHMLDKFVTDTPEFNNKRFFTQQEPSTYGGEDEFLAQHIIDENARDHAARENYAEGEAEREAREADEAERHQRELEAMEEELQKKRAEEAANRIIRVRRHKKAAEELEAKRAIAAAKAKAQEAQADADPFAGFAASGGGGAPAGISEYARPLLSRHSSIGSDTSDITGMTTSATDFTSAGTPENISTLYDIAAELSSRQKIPESELHEIKARMTAAGVARIGKSFKQNKLLEILKSHAGILSSSGNKSAKLKKLNEGSFV